MNILEWVFWETLSRQRIKCHTTRSDSLFFYFLKQTIQYNIWLLSINITGLFQVAQKESGKEVVAIGTPLKLRRLPLVYVWNPFLLWFPRYEFSNYYVNWETNELVNCTYVWTTLGLRMGWRLGVVQMLQRIPRFRPCKLIEASKRLNVRTPGFWVRYHACSWKMATLT